MSSAESLAPDPSRRLWAHRWSWLRRVASIVAICALVASACSGSDDDAGSSDSEADPDGALAATESNDEGSGGDDDQTTGASSRFGSPVAVIVPNTPGTLTTTGTQRVMAALVGNGPNAYLGGPDQPVTIRFSAVNGDGGGEVEGTWLSTDVSTLGLYVAPFEFDEAGLWEIVALADGEELGGVLFEVVEESAVPTLGDPAPATPTPTAATVEEAVLISTDPEPVLDLYRLSVDEAVANGRPTVVAFATPAFCRTALCGPTLEAVKAAAVGRDGLDVVHVEPFDLEQAPGGVLIPIDAMEDWGLVTEPWVFVVDADGLIAASFEGIMGQGELESALDGLSG